MSLCYVAAVIHLRNCNRKSSRVEQWAGAWTARLISTIQIRILPKRVGINIKGTDLIVSTDALAVDGTVIPGVLWLISGIVLRRRPNSAAKVHCCA